jgi:hypothetical protein
MKDRVEMFLRANQFASHLNRVARRDLRGKVGDGIPVDSNAAGKNEFFNAAARSEAGGSEETV